MKFKSWLLEGGNTHIKVQNKIIKPQKIPLKEIGRKKFITVVQDFLINFNKLFHSKYGYYIWADENEIRNAGIFNGSTSFVMSQEYTDDEILKYKSEVGDIDIAVPKEAGKDIFNFLKKIQGTSYARLTDNMEYIGCNAKSENRLGSTIICIVKMYVQDISIYAQIDLELTEVIGGRQTDWAAFAHSSSFEDIKQGYKGVANKHLWRALVGAMKQIDKDFIVLTPSSTINNPKIKLKQPKQIRLLSFGVKSGVGARYEIMQKDGKPLKIHSKIAYREKKPSEKTYDKNLVNLMKLVFNVTNIKPSDLHSFIKVLKLADKHLDQSTKQKVLDRFQDILFCNNGGQCQSIEQDPKEDIRLKTSMYKKAAELLHLKETKNLDTIIKNYLAKTHNVKENFRNIIKDRK